jgi:GNAT superfamily N-acetyltransferase
VTAIAIRSVEPADEPIWRELWRGYCDFYEQRIPEEVTVETWRRLLDPGAGTMFGVVAVDGGDVVGFAHCVLHPSTWSRATTCYLEDLFVAPGARGRGAGRALIEALLERAREDGWRHVYWHTNRDNRTARALYDSFARADGFVRYVVEPR